MREEEDDKKENKAYRLLLGEPEGKISTGKPSRK
jgi:hypothetical protein